MISQKRLFGTNGIRGVVNKELTPQLAIEIGSAIGAFFKQGRIIVGHDARTSGVMLSKAVIAGLTATGCDVLFAGMAPTPALQYAVKKHKTQGAVIITASHNPPEYNGIKVIWNDGIELCREQEIQIEETYSRERTCYAEWNKIGIENSLIGVISDYIEAMKKHVNTARIARKKYHVVVDAANSVGGLAAPYLLRELGCRVTTLNANIDGTFPGRLPEPRPENLTGLSSTVEALDADLGVAFDGDADRSVFVDERGDIQWGDKTFALIEKYFLKENKGEKIVTPVSSSTLIKDIADAYDGEIIWTKVGSVTVSQTMKQLHAKLGGEENGGIFYTPHNAVRDGAMATALILDIMAKTGRKLSELVSELPRYFIQKSKMDCPETIKDKVLQKLAKQLKNQKVNTTDGVKIWFEDRSAILIRPSGTEPIYRLYAEARTEERAAKLVKEYGLKLKRLINSVKAETTLL